MRASLRTGLLLTALGIAPMSYGQVSIPLTVSGNQAQGSVSLLGIYQLDLTISFDSASGLTPSSLAATATLVSPFDPNLLSRLLGMVSIPTGFPVLLNVSPVAGGGLSFTGEATVSFHTPNLELLPGVPLSLLKASNGGAFQDITSWEGSGSYRCSGSSGSFSDFLIVLDGRLIDSVINGKFVALQNSLNSYSSSMPPTVVSTLQTMLTQAQTAYQGRDLATAIQQTTAFSSYVEAESGSAIPDIWSSADPTQIDVAGILRGGADTLTFSLKRESGQ